MYKRLIGHSCHTNWSHKLVTQIGHTVQCTCILGQGWLGRADKNGAGDRTRISTLLKAKLG